MGSPNTHRPSERRADNRDLPDDLARPWRYDYSAWAGIIIGSVLLAICLLGLAYALWGGI